MAPTGVARSKWVSAAARKYPRSRNGRASARNTQFGRWWCPPDTARRMESRQAPTEKPFAEVLHGETAQLQQRKYTLAPWRALSGPKAHLFRRSDLSSPSSSAASRLSRWKACIQLRDLLTRSAFLAQG